MRDFGKVSPLFWTGKTGKELRGHPEAQIVAFYLMTSPHSEMIGVYQLPKLYLLHETGLSVEGASKGLQRCIDVGFCMYDEATEMVFVVEMGAHQVGEILKSSDHRTKGIHRAYLRIAETMLGRAFFDRYSVDWDLPSKPLGSPLEGALTNTEGASKPLSLSPSLSPSPEGRRTKSRKRQIPADFAISERVKTWASEKGHTQLEQRFEHFVGVARAKGYEYADWDEAFMGAIRDNWAKLAAPTASTNVPGGGRRAL